MALGRTATGRLSRFSALGLCLLAAPVAAGPLAAGPLAVGPVARGPVGAGLLAAGPAAAAASPEALAREILAATGVQGGLVVHLGCGDGRLTAALRAGGGFLVHGLERSAAKLHAARETIRSLGLYGPVSADRFDGEHLPYADGIVNLLVAEEPGAVPASEILRVLCPGGTAYLRDGERWTKETRPWPREIDDWTHYLHDASNNAVARDTVVAPPRRLQWTGSPRFTRHHDRLSSLNALVSAAGRLLYIFDEATGVSILAPPRWTLIARDAFNGTVLWKRRLGPWHTHLWPLKSGPAQLPRRLVAAHERVYVTLSLGGPVSVLDAATGQTVRTCDDTRGAEEILLSGETLFVLADENPPEPTFAGLHTIETGYSAKFWDERPRRVMALRAASGEVLWSTTSRVVPLTLAAGEGGLFFHDGERIACLDRATGDALWRSQPVARAGTIRSFYAPTLVVYEDVVLFAGGETAGEQTGTWYTSGKDSMTALAASTGQILWSAYHPPSGYRSPEDLLVVNGLVWTGETTSGRARGVFTGRDPRTGEVKASFPPDVETYWFHHRCYRGKATSRFLLMSRSGTEFIDVEKQTWTPHHWFRGACLYGVMPANGLIYAPPHPCACYLEAKLCGFNALAPGPAGPLVAASGPRLEKGPAWGEEVPSEGAPDDWPTYRHDPSRSGSSPAAVVAALEPAWESPVGGRLTSPVVAEGKVLVASVDEHAVHALDADSGRPLWRFTAGGRVDSPPAVHRGRALFGAADGWVYALRSQDGALLWRFRAAPADQRIVAFEGLESVWPVPGNVLVQDGVLWCVAGRSMFLDGGLRLLRIDPETGRLLSETILGEHDLETGRDLHAYVSWLNMPAALPDVLSSDGRLVYMRSQPFRLDGTRLSLKPFPRGADADRGAPPPDQDPGQAHLFSPTGFLDGSWWHRSYWLYGSAYVSGWCGYYLAGKAAPAGRILVFDDARVYGFGRKPQYYRWTTPIEHHLFAASRTLPAGGHAGASRVRVARSPSLDPAGKPLTVEVWIQASHPGGVAIARGGAAHGYALYLEGGRPAFSVRAGGKHFSVSAREEVTGAWTHLAGVLRPPGGLEIHVNGRLAGTAEGPASIPADPQEAMEIGADEGSAVGEYTSPFVFDGLIDEVRVHHRALSPEEIAAAAAGGGMPDPEAGGGPVLWLSFDEGDGKDSSGRGNTAKIEGAVAAEGRRGKAMRFTAGAARKYLVEHHWRRDIPLLARAMVLAGGTLFVAGPPDLVDEPRLFQEIDDPGAQSRLAEQAAAIEGERGALLLAVAAEDGSELARSELPSPPVFDGLAAAGSRLFLSAMDGKVRCFAPRRR